MTTIQAVWRNGQFAFLTLVVIGQAHGQFPWQKPVKRDPAEVQRIVGPMGAREPSRDLNIVWVWGIDKLHEKETHEYAWVMDRYVNVLLPQIPRVTVTPSMYFPKKELWEKADLVVFYMWPRREGWDYDLIDTYQKRGGGLIVIHMALMQGSGEEWSKRIGMAWDLKRDGTKWGVLPTPVTLTEAARTSPIFERFPPKFDLADEFYWELRRDPAKITPLVTSCKRANVFDLMDNSWRQLADLPSAITHMNLVLDGRSIWFAGGFKDGYKGYAISEVWRYDIDKNTYTAGPSLPQPRASGGLAIVGRTLHFVGGLTKDRDTCSAEHWVLDLKELARGNAKWKEAKPMSKGRCHFGTVTFDGKIYLIGGMYHHDSQQIDLPLVDIYDPETDSWSKGENLPTGHTHAEASTFVHNNRIYFLGGMAQVGERRWIDNKITALTPEGKWEHVGELPQPLSASAAGIVAGKLYLAGGSPNGATPQPGMWVRPAP